MGVLGLIWLATRRATHLIKWQQLESAEFLLTLVLPSPANLQRKWYFSISQCPGCVKSGGMAGGRTSCPLSLGLSVWRCVTVSALHLPGGSVRTMLDWTSLNYTCKVGGRLQIMTNWRSLILNPISWTPLKSTAGGRIRTVQARCWWSDCSN